MVRNKTISIHKIHTIVGIIVIAPFHPIAVEETIWFFCNTMSILSLMINIPHLGKPISL